MCPCLFDLVFLGLHAVKAFNFHISVFLHLPGVQIIFFKVKDCCCVTTRENKNDFISILKKYQPLIFPNNLYDGCYLKKWLS